MREFVKILEEMAFLAELLGENPFKVRAFQNAADILEESGRELEDLVKSGEITKVAGIGKGTQALVKEFLETGKVAEHEKLRANFPENILELREVRGLGPKKIKALYDALQISSLAELEYACQENRLVDLKGFGEKTQTNILKSIESIKGSRGKVILPVALQESETILEQLRELAGVEKAVPTGELRRLNPVIASLDFVAAGKKEQIEKALAKAGFVAGEGNWRKNSESGPQIRVWAAGSAEFGSTLFTSTGPEAYVAKMGKVSPATSEEKIFADHRLAVLPPEARDLPACAEKLVEEKDIRGVFHLHTQWSDGKNTLEEMVEAAAELGLEYLGVSDHSQTAFYAHGLDEKRVLQQKKEIEAVQKKFPQIRIFHGIESDILADGSLDYPKDFLKNFDFVIASVHGQMKMNRADMTKRLIRAVENPATTWLGHWTGRLLLGREGYDFDAEAVMKAAANAGCSIELNANPYRLDIDWTLLPKASALDLPIGIFPDAHSTHGLADFKYGVWMARKGGLTAKNVVNTKGRKEMEAWLAARKRN